MTKIKQLRLPSKNKKWLNVENNFFWLAGVLDHSSVIGLHVQKTKQHPFAIINLVPSFYLPKVSTSVFTSISNTLPLLDTNVNKDEFVTKISCQLTEDLLKFLRSCCYLNCWRLDIISDVIDLKKRQSLSRPQFRKKLTRLHKKWNNNQVNKSLLLKTREQMSQDGLICWIFGFFEEGAELLLTVKNNKIVLTCKVSVYQSNRSGLIVIQNYFQTKAPIEKTVDGFCITLTFNDFKNEENFLKFFLNFGFCNPNLFKIQKRFSDLEYILQTKFSLKEAKKHLDRDSFKHYRLITKKYNIKFD